MRVLSWNVTYLCSSSLKALRVVSSCSSALVVVFFVVSRMLMLIFPPQEIGEPRAVVRRGC